MEDIKNFLESSTIHGLAYISSSKKICRVFWILVVIFGIFLSFVWIYISCKKWEESPVTTTISNHPITDINFPKVTVCPPKHTYTDLNFDLMMTENMTLLDNITRNELLNNALQMLQNQMKKSRLLSAFKKFYEGLFQDRISPNLIILTLNRLLKIDSENKSIQNISKSLLEDLTTRLSLQYPYFKQLIKYMKKKKNKPDIKNLNFTDMNILSGIK